jgi:hypothetical protein
MSYVYCLPVTSIEVCGFGRCVRAERDLWPHQNARSYVTSVLGFILPGCGPVSTYIPQ